MPRSGGVLTAFKDRGRQPGKPEDRLEIS